MSPGEVFANDDVMRQKLREPFPPEQIGKLPKPTKKENQKGKCKECGEWHGLPAIHLDFVGHAAVTDRLLKEAPDYTYHIDHMETVGGHLQGILATLTIGGKSIQEAGAVEKQSTWGEELKLAISDFVRRGAMRFGVALDLWSKEDLQAVPASNNGGNDWDAIEAKVSGGGDGSLAYGEGANGSDPSPENVTVGDGNPSSLGSSPAVALPASQETWAEARAVGITGNKALKIARDNGLDLTSASEIGELYLRGLIGAAKESA